MRNYKMKSKVHSDSELVEQNNVRTLFSVVLCHYVHSIKGGWQHLDETVNFLLMQCEHVCLPFPGHRIFSLFFIHIRNCFIHFTGWQIILVSASWYLWRLDEATRGVIFYGEYSFLATMSWQHIVPYETNWWDADFWTW